MAEMKKFIKDHKGYLRFNDEKKRLVHRWVAYKEIYLKNRNKYPYDFKDYQIHHKDRNKLNNNPDNLELIPVRDHELKHNVERYEYAVIETYFVFILWALGWFGYISWVSNYKLNTKDVIFFAITSIGMIIIIYLINRKKKGVKYV